MYEFRMPSLGADMEAGILSKWLVQPGDRVKRGDVVAIIETEKSDIEVEIFATGVMERIVVEKGQKVPVGTLLATVATNGAEPHPLSPSPVPPPSAGRGGTPAVSGGEVEAKEVRERPPSPARERGTGGEVKSSPAARKKAAELGLDLSTLTGTGPGGAITLADVEKTVPVRIRSHPVARKMAEALGVDLAQIKGTGVGGTITKADVEAAASAAPRPEETPRDRAAAMRRAIGAAMARSKREIPHYYLATEIDLRRALRWLEDENRRRPVEQRLLPAALLLKAVALALREVPELNGFWVDGAFRPGEGIHPGVAISLRGGGLIAPAIHDADKKSLDELMAGLRDLVQRARAGTLRSSEMSDPTITVTNLGDQGVETVFGVIYPPQVALVGLGRIVERPWAEDGMLGIRPVLTATLSGDHRATDGHKGGLFLAALDRLLQEPEKP